VSNIRDHSNHVVVETVSIVSVRSVPESRSHSESSEGLLEGILVSGVNSKIRVVADSSSGMVISNVRSIVARLEDLHLVFAKKTSSLICEELFVISNGTSGSISRKAASPIVSLVHVIMSSAV